MSKGPVSRKQGQCNILQVTTQQSTSSVTTFAHIRIRDSASRRVVPWHCMKFSIIFRSHANSPICFANITHLQRLNLFKAALASGEQLSAHGRYYVIYIFLIYYHITLFCI